MPEISNSSKRSTGGEPILVVDDDEAARYSRARILRNAGFETLEAASGEEALAHVGAIPVGLLVLDVTMRPVSGLEVVQRLRANAKTSPIPILLVSATYRDSESLVTGLDTGADAYLTEPLDPSVFVATCRALLRMGRAERERVRVEQELAAAERRRAEMAETLNREINHRVKNNLVLISALFQMHMERAEAGGPLQQALRDASARVHALSTVHEQMAEGRPDEVDLPGALRRTLELTQHALAVREVECDVSLVPLKASASGATATVLLANELLTNALKYGAPAPSGRVQISMELALREPDRVVLSVWNSGNPIPDGFSLTSKQGLGLQIASIMVTQQLGGRLTLRPKNGGTLAEAILDRSLLLPSDKECK